MRRQSIGLRDGDGTKFVARLITGNKSDDGERAEADCPGQLILTSASRYCLSVSRRQS